MNDNHIEYNHGKGSSHGEGCAKIYKSRKALQDHLKKTHIKNVFVLTWMDGGLVG